jgi:hypothetical protein
MVAHVQKGTHASTQSVATRRRYSVACNRRHAVAGAPQFLTVDGVAVGSGTVVCQVPAPDGAAERIHAPCAGG